MDWTVVHQFLDIALAFPTLGYTLVLGLVVLYWLTVIVGAADMELFEGHVDGLLDAGHDLPLAHDLGGHDVHIEHDLDIGHDVHIEHDLDAGGHDVDAGHDVDHDVAHDGHDHDTQGGPSGLLHVLSGFLKLGQVPITITGSFITLYAWAICYAIVYLFHWQTPLLGMAALASAFFGSLPPTSATVHPLGKYFKVHEGMKRHELVGQTCTVSTMRVDGKIGQAEWLSEGTSLLLQVRCDRADNQLKKGAQALIIHYDEARNAYVVEPIRTPAKREVSQSHNGPRTARRQTTEN